VEIVCCVDGAYGYGIFGAASALAEANEA
jgi:hypothetical protein